MDHHQRLHLFALLPTALAGFACEQSTDSSLQQATTQTATPATRPSSKPAIPPAAVPIVTGRRGADALSARVDGRVAVIDIRSRSGIGGGTITLPAGNAPQTLRLCLHLAGLESLRVTGGSAAVDISVLSHGGHRVLRRLHRADSKDAADLNPDDARCPAVRLLDAEGKPTTKIPIPRGGYVEVTLPAALLKELGPSLELQWIDFYR